MLWSWLLGCGGPAMEAETRRPCADCHPAEVAAWEGSRHALAERALGPEDGWARELGAERVIGVRPLVQALVPAAGGRLQAHDLAVDTRDGARFSVFEDPRSAGDWGHWTGGGNTWNSRCAACHTTGFRKGLGPDGVYRSTHAALGVGCAACHGGVEAHAAGGPPPSTPPMESTCGPCHMLRGELGIPLAPDLALLDQVAPVLLDDPAFGPDGRARGETFELNHFLGSAMHAAGVRCADCHLPHGDGLRAEGDALCARCHDALGPAPEHGAHQPALACVDCHMPPTTVMARHARRDHGFTSPRQGAAADACAGCHPDRPAPAPPDPQVEAFAAARAGGPWRALDLAHPIPARRAANLALLAQHPADPEARAALRTALRAADPLIRFAAADALQAQDAADLAALRQAADDPVRAVRTAAQRALAHAGDPVGADLARLLDHHADDPALRAERGTLRVRAQDPRGLDDLAAAVAMDPSAPGLVVQRAVGLAQAGRPAEALAVLEAGPPTDAGVQEALGLALAGAGRLGAAEAALERALTLDPERPRAWRNLALLQARAGRIPAARQSAAQALRRAPEDIELAQWAAGLGAEAP